MRETERRIRQYRAQLPRIRERIIAALVLFAFSVVMMTMSAFAWTTLSISPEVSGVTTTIAANGNLEIALSNKEGTQPNESGINDGNLELTLRNLTWGNLVNLAHKDYGLDYLSLRPASLNEYGLNTEPLYSAEYDHTGRMIGKKGGFAYTTWTWNDPVKKDMGNFKVSKESAYGVRAISSVTYDKDAGPYLKLANSANGQLQTIKDRYQVLTAYPGTEYYGGKTNHYMEALATLMSIYVQAQVDERLSDGSGDVTFNKNNTNLNALENMVAMMKSLLDYYIEAGEVLVDIVEMYQMSYRDANPGTEYNRYTTDALYEAAKNSSNDLTSIGIDTVTLATIISWANDVNILTADYETLASYYEKARGNSETITWNTHVYPIVNRLVDIDTCTINGKPMKTVIPELLAAIDFSSLNISAILNSAIDKVLGGKYPPVVIKEGLVKNFEALTGGRMSVNGLEISATALYIVTIRMYPSITTNAEGSRINDAINTTYNNASSGESRGDARAADTFGLAVDFWIRTNAPGTYLTLEGNLITTPEPVYIMVDGQQLPVLIAKVRDGEDEEGNAIYKEYEVYEDPTNESESAVYLSIENHEEITGITSTNPKTEDVVIGYEGTNRIWSNKEVGDQPGQIPLYSTSQGSGSCYTFYSDPVESVKILEMLEGFKIAFVDANGELLATAGLDTKNYYEDYGKYVLPIVLDSGPTLSDEEGNPYHAITRLEKNDPVRITALVYLDGVIVENDNVLSAAEIEGNLNIQFGSSYQLVSLDDDKLNIETRIASAKIKDGSTTSFSYSLGDNGQPVKHTVPVEVVIEGAQPTTMTASFIRKLSDTHGIYQDEFILVYNDETKIWEGTAEFTMPGEYILRTIRIDGADYALNLTDPDALLVTVEGFTVENVNLNNNGKTIMTADASVVDTLQVTLSAGDAALMPRMIRGIFFSEYNERVTVILNAIGAGTEVVYSGDARFVRSGTYKMEYIEINGELVPLRKEDQKSITVYTGLSVETWTYNGVEDRFLLEDNQMKEIEMAMRITDSSGNQIKNLPDNTINLFYLKNGSALDINGVNTKMKWNSDTELYTGKFNISSIGRYTFGSVVIQINGVDNVIRTAISAPTFVAFNTQAVKFVGTTSSPETPQFAPDNDARLNLTLANATAVEYVYAKIERLNTTARSGESVLETYIVEANRDSNGNYPSDTYEFQIPTYTDETGATVVDGTWRIASVKVTGVYDTEGYEIKGGAPLTTVEEYDTAEKYFEFKASDFIGINEDGNPEVIEIRTEVFSKMHFIYTESSDGSMVGGFKVFGATDNNGDGSINDTDERTANIMTKHDLGTIQLELTDPNGNSVVDRITNVTIEYKYNGGMADYGSYTGNDTPAPINNLVFTKVDLDGDGINDVFECDASDRFLQTAGKYTVTITVKVANRDYTVSSDGSLTSSKLNGVVPTYTVYSKKPTVKVKATDPKPGTTKRVYSVKTPISSAQAIRGDFFRFSDYIATVYIHTPLADGGSYDQEAAEAYAPTVTLELSGVSEGYSGATMTFETAHSDSNDSVFNFTDGTAKAEIGKAVNGQRGLFGVSDYPECYPAGRMTQNQINITYGSATYTVDLSHEVTIDQPQSPSVLVFAGIPDTYKDTKPEQVVGVGSSVTVKLPELYWTATIEEPKDGTWSDYTPVGEVAEVNGQNTKRLSYTHWQTDGACGSKVDHYTYQYFIWTKFESSITAQTDIYTQDKKIVQWMINGVTYNAGETVTVVGDGIITATAVVADNGVKTFKETAQQTTYKYLYGYVAQDKVSDSSTAPDMNVTALQPVGSTANAALPQPKIADISNADAATDTPGINTTTDSALFADYLK